MSRPRSQILVLRFHGDRMAQWREHPEPRGATESALDPTIRFCNEGLWSVLGRRILGVDQIQVRVSAEPLPRARPVALTGAVYGDGISWREIGGQQPIATALPRIRAFLSRVLGRPPVVGDVVWVEVLR